MKTLLIVLLIVSIVLTILMFIKNKKKAKFIAVIPLLLIIALYSIKYIPSGIKSRIFPEYLGSEIKIDNSSLQYLNDDFNSDSLNADWVPLNIEIIDMALSNGQLIMTPKVESVWWMKDHGPMIYKMAEGDFSFSTKVQTRKASDTSRYPDKVWQFGGLILRDPASENTQRGENYVFIVVGYRGSKLQVEVKSTLSGKSDVIGIDWPTGDAEVRITRRGKFFTLMARKSSSDDWQVMETYERADLPQKLQAGIIVYSFSYNKGIIDLTARFDEIKFWKSQIDF